MALIRGIASHIFVTQQDLTQPENIRRGEIELQMEGLIHLPKQRQVGLFYMPKVHPSTWSSSMALCFYQPGSTTELSCLAVMVTLEYLSCHSVPLFRQPNCTQCV